MVGDPVGSLVGAVVGSCVSSGFKGGFVGFIVGDCDGAMVVGTAVGFAVGFKVYRVLEAMGMVKLAWTWISIMEFIFCSGKSNNEMTSTCNEKSMIRLVWFSSHYEPISV
eukprot:520212_1